MTSKEEELTVLEPGQIAPEFSAALYPKGTFQLIHSSQAKRNLNLILAFYPRNNSPGCTREICAFNSDKSRFLALDTEIVGVSCDSLDSHEKFSLKHNLEVSLISDFDGKIGRLYGTLREGHRSANRSLFIIDKSGIIRHIHEGMPDNEELLKIIDSLSRK